MRYAILLIPLIALLAFACDDDGAEPSPTATESALVEPTSDAATTPEAAAETLAFVRDGAIWLIDVDGSGETRLTNISAQALRWSADGTRIAFAVCEVQESGSGPCRDRIYLVNSDGSGLAPLADVIAIGLEWSPDGARIAFPISFPSNTAGINVIEADGSGRTRLSDIPASSVDWSPDGTRIVFASSDSDDNADIYVMNADGSGLVALTDSVEPDASPAWSPDAASIVFTSVRDGNLNIYIMSAEGAAVTRLTDDPGQDSSPVWSPNGSRIAYLSGTGATVENADLDIGYPVADIYLVNPDGSGLTKLADSAFAKAPLAWSPDGSKIAFTRVEPDGTLAVYVMNADGSDQTRVAEGVLPAWQPQP